MAKVKDGKWSVTSSALWELDILLKNSRISNEERFDVFNALASEFPVERITPVTHASLATAAHLQKTYPGIRSFYFDSIHIAVAIQTDGVIVSSDASFDRVRGVERIDLDSL